MSTVSAKDFLDLSKMLPEQRFEYALTKMIEDQSLWGLFGANGWVMVKADEDTCMPIWPHEEFATSWVKEDFPDCQPKQIEFSQWCEMWLPGMQKNNTLVLVFPLGEDEEGIILEAQELAECIDEDLAELENKK
ncbi:DUF2750 domain-containing protein [Paraglaciecola aquimarina]|uniref:DUF2750 domain-containing protein n=1 Tax=Paraglaciecola algarum TaxID=3050085 RepID=A0ABS9DBF3_9ALTE|nr:DUF2750 domain-containing protein [Paraglaciecola sp. G1-23]MCF2948971.1 DUF2750 domain-containing protein [Paraglaciecola sp. G1-23]